MFLEFSSKKRSILQKAHLADLPPTIKILSVVTINMEDIININSPWNIGVVKLDARLCREKFMLKTLVH